MVCSISSAVVMVRDMLGSTRRMGPRGLWMVPEQMLRMGKYCLMEESLNCQLLKVSNFIIVIATSSKNNIDYTYCRRG